VIPEGRIVNTITAGPLLNLLLALAGMEVPGDPADVWPIFRKFAAVASASDLDVVSFQVSWEERDNAVGVRCCWTRQLRDDAAGYGTIDRLVEVVYAYERASLAHPQELELWSDQFASLDAFFGDAESRPEFRFLLDNIPDGGSIVVEDLYQPDELE
jgi:hypothetical protein